MRNEDVRMYIVMCLIFGIMCACACLCIFVRTCICVCLLFVHLHPHTSYTQLCELECEFELGKIKTQFTEIYSRPFPLMVILIPFVHVQKKYKIWVSDRRHVNRVFKGY